MENVRLRESLQIPTNNTTTRKLERTSCNNDIRRECRACSCQVQCNCKHKSTNKTIEKIIKYHKELLKIGSNYGSEKILFDKIKLEQLFKNYIDNIVTEGEKNENLF